MSMYPYFFEDGVTPMGYCQVTDVSSRIKQGGYNPDVPGGIGSIYIEQYILQAAAQIDMELARAGYGVPLIAVSGDDSLGNPLVIGPQVYSLLLMINATGAAGYVEMWRHAEDASQADTQSMRLLTLFDDLLGRLGSGEDNLALFNVAGPWPPEADPALAMDDGTGDADQITGIVPQPQFTIVPNQGGGSDLNGNPFFAPNPLTFW